MAIDKFKQLVYGHSVKQDNRSYPPTMGTVNTSFITPTSSAAICADAAVTIGATSYAKGDILFYTDGKTVYNSADAIMNSGTLNGLGGDSDNAQGVFIIKSSETNYWWIFSLDVANNKVWVSTVNMAGDSGKGSVDEKATSQTFASTPTERMAAYYDGAAAKYGFVIHLAGSNTWVAYKLSGVSSHNPTFAAAVNTAIGSSYNNNNAANHATVKFNGNNTKLATVYQATVGTSGTPVTTAKIELFDFNVATGVLSTATSHTIDINDAGPVTIGSGAQRLKGFDLEFDFDAPKTTIYVPVFNSTLGMGIQVIEFNASNVETSRANVTNSFLGTKTWGDRAIWSLLRDPYDDKIYVAAPSKTSSTGGHSADYNDTYAITRVSALVDTSDVSAVSYVDTASPIRAGYLQKGLGTRAINNETSASSSKFSLSPCNLREYYLLDINGIIWSLNGSWDALQVADVSGIADRKAIAVNEETGFLYLLAGTGATPSLHKINPITGNVVSVTSLSGTGIVGFQSIAGKDGDALKLYAVVEIAGSNYNYAEIVLATGVATKTAGNTAIVMQDMVMVGADLYAVKADTLYKNTGPGTWSTVGTSGIGGNWSALTENNSSIFGFISDPVTGGTKKYAINKTTGAASYPVDITKNEGTTNFDTNLRSGSGAYYIVGFPIITSDVTVLPYVGQTVTVENFGGCYTVATSSSGAAAVAVGNVLSHHTDCTECMPHYAPRDCKILIDCCSTGPGIPQRILGTTDDVTVNVGGYYEITGNTADTNLLNKCVTVSENDESVYITFYNGEVGKIDVSTGIVTSLSGITTTKGMTFDEDGNGIILKEGGDIVLARADGFSDEISMEANSLMFEVDAGIAFDGSTFYAAGVKGGVSKLVLGTLDSEKQWTQGTTLTNGNIQLTGDIAFDKSDRLIYCIGDGSPSGTPETNDLFTVDTTTFTNTSIASLTTTLSLSGREIVKGITFQDTYCKVLVWDSGTGTLRLHTIERDGTAISSTILQKEDGSTVFSNTPTSLSHNNPCTYYDTSSYQVKSYTSCAACSESTTSKNCNYKLVNCKNNSIKYTSVDLSSDVGKIISLNEPGLFKCYTVYNTFADVATSDVTKLASYDDCVSCDNSETTIYRLLKCNDETSDPKYTTEDLTPGISRYLNKVAILENEYYGRTVDNLGDSSHSLSTAAVVVVNSAPDCSGANFFSRLTACNDPSRVIDIDYATSDTIHPYINTTKAISINNLGNGEDEICWNVASWIEGPVSHVYKTVTFLGAEDDCDTCATNAIAAPPGQVYLESCCNTPTVLYCPNQYYFTMGPDLDIGLGDAGQIVEADITDPDSGITYTGCWKVETPALPVAPPFVSSSNIITVFASDELGNSPGPSCHACTYSCEDTGGCEILACDVTQVNQFVECGGLSDYQLDAGAVTFMDGDIAKECYRICKGKFDGIHGVQWFWGSGAGLKWDLLGLPYSTNDGNTVMGMGITAMTPEINYTKFQSAVHCVHEDITIGAKSYTKGDILFYTDGHQVWTSNHTLMVNGMNLAGGSMALPVSDVNSTHSNYKMATQQAIIVPDPAGGFIGTSSVHAWYYIFYQSTGDGPFYMARVFFDGGDGLGVVAPDTVDTQIHPSSTERLCVSSRPATGNGEEEVYWVAEVEPWKPLDDWPDEGTPLENPNAVIRIHKISETAGLEIDYSTFNIGSSWIQGELNTFQQMSVTARLKFSSDNQWLVMTGMQTGGQNWTQVFRFNPGDGTVFMIPTGQPWTDAGDLNCNPDTGDTCNTGIQTNFVPHLSAVEFDATSSYLYILKSGSIYPPFQPSGNCVSGLANPPRTTKLIRRALDPTGGFGFGSVGDEDIVEDNIQYLPGTNQLYSQFDVTAEPNCPAFEAENSVSLFKMPPNVADAVAAAVSEFAAVPSVNEPSSEKAPPPPVNLKKPLVKF